MVLHLLLFPSISSFLACRQYLDQGHVGSDISFHRCRINANTYNWVQTTRKLKVGELWGFGQWSTVFKSWFCHLLALPLWVAVYIFLSLNSVNCETGDNNLFASKAQWDIPVTTRMLLPFHGSQIRSPRGTTVGPPHILSPAPIAQ